MIFLEITSGTLVASIQVVPRFASIYFFNSGLSCHASRSDQLNSELVAA